MAERRVSVRLVAVGGDKLKAELTGIGREGRRALEGVAAESRGASHGLGGVGTSAGAALAQREALATRAARAAATLRAAGASIGTLVERVNQVTGVAPRVARSADDIAAYGRALDDLRARHNPLFAAIRSYRATLADIRQAHAVGAISADEMSAAISRERQASLASIAAIKGRGVALTQMGAASRNAAFQSRMLMFQLNDVFVSLASGMNPMMVFVQQGAQIQQIYGGQGGVNAALRDTSRMLGGVVTRIPVLTAAVVLATAAIAGMRHEINETSDVTVGFGDVALAIWQTVRDGAWSVLKPAVDAIAPWFSSAWDVVIDSTHWAGNAFINTWRAAVAAVGAAWDTLPEMVGAAVIAATNLTIAGVEAMVNRTIGMLNTLSDGVNAMLAKIPGLGEGFRIGSLDELDFGRLDNPLADRVAGRAEETSGRIAGIFASDPLGEAFGSIRDRAVANALDETAEAAEGAGGALRKAGGAARKAMKTAKEGAHAATDALSGYAREALDLGKGLGSSLVGAFRSAENAVGEFVRTGKLGVRDMITSIIADLAQLATRRFVLGPLANALSGAFGGVLGPASAAALPSYAGGGHTGYGARLGGLDGRGGFLAMMHPQERVIDETRRDRGEPAPVHVTINARDAQSFRQSRTQVAADLARAVGAGRRGM